MELSPFNFVRRRSERIRDIGDKQAHQTDLSPFISLEVPMIDFLNHRTTTATAILNGVAFVAELLFIAVAIKYLV